MTGDATRSHGKVILFGEHAAVHGHPALAMGIADALVADSVERTDGSIRVVVPAWNLDSDDRSNDAVGEALRRLSVAMPGMGGCTISARASIPMGAGLGSSAALAVLAVRSLARVRDVPLDGEMTRTWAHEMERVFHGDPSGLDDAVATYGGLCLFRKAAWQDGEPAGVPVHRIAPGVLAVGLGAPPLVVGDSGVGRSTAAMVAMVRRQHDDERGRVEEAFASMDTCLYNGLAALGSAEGAGRLGDAMTACHGALAGLRLSCPEIDRMVSLALGAGALGAKLTGAGGGGCAVAFAPGREDDVVLAWKANGFRAWVVGG